LGAFFEHVRVFYFHNGGAQDIYLSSADWMDRNFFGRIELCFPVLDAKLKKRVIREALTPCLNGTAGTWELDSNGSYKLRKSPPRKGVHAHDYLLGELAIG
jgi:polyphosphate kinase